MKIAVASGKGGTGKTTISTNIARVLSRKNKVQYLDCDVEEPNGHLFLKPSMNYKKSVEVPVPQIDNDKCVHCGKCSNFCAFNALASLEKDTLVFPQLCHGCGGCMLVCPVEAIEEKGREIGILEKGESRGVQFVHGKLKVGEVMSPPLIREVIRNVNNEGIAIFDAPPGTSCPVIASLKESEIVVLVTEPTPFGLNDLILAVDMVRALKIPFGVIINQTDIGDDCIEKYCKKENIAIWGRIPHDKRIARKYSSGELAVDVLPDIRGIFEKIAFLIVEEVAR